MKVIQSLGYFLLSFIPVILLFGILVYFLDQSQREKKISELILEYEKGLDLRVELVENYIESTLADSYFISKLLEFNKSTNEEELRKSLTEEFFQFSQASRYHQIRLLDTTGMETIRVDFYDRKAHVISQEKLQNKSHRDYYQKGKELSNNEIYISSFDLNMEHGAIQVPLRPALRFVSPLFDSQNQKAGLLVINSDPKSLLTQLEKLSITQQSDFNFYLLDTGGYALNKQSQITAYGFHFDSLKNEKMGIHFPEAWEKISREQSGHFLSDNGIFVFKKLNYNKLIERFNTNHSTNISSPTNREKILVAHLNNTLLNQKIASHRPLLFLGTIALLLLIMTLWVTRLRIKTIDTNEALKRNLRNIQETKQLLAAKNEELESFIRIASHDLREPLATIRGVTKTLEVYTSQPIDGKFQKYIDFILECSDRMERLTKSVLDYAVTGRNSELVLTDCDDLVENILLDLQSSIVSSEATVRFAELPVIYAYKLELTQVFQNLISNAIKYRKTDRAPVIQISYERKADFHEFRVSDNGIGIRTKEDQDEVFKMFSRLKKNDENGIGIGLAICRKIAELHGGAIWVEDSSEKGTTFVVTLKVLDSQQIASV